MISNTYSELRLIRINYESGYHPFNRTDAERFFKYCWENFLDKNNQTEISIFLDTNIISHIRKYVFQESSFDDRGRRIIYELVMFLRQANNVFFSPALAFDESGIDLFKKNFFAFEKFCRIHFSDKLSDAYNSLSDINFDAKQHYIFLYIWASVFTVYYVRKKFADLSSEQKFNKFLNLLVENLGELVDVVLPIAILSFLDFAELEEAHKKIVRNFIKSGNSKKQSLNAAYDLTFLATIAFSDGYQPEGYKLAMNSWGLTVDQGLADFSNLVSFNRDKKTFAFLTISDEKNRDYFDACVRSFKEKRSELKCAQIQNHINSGQSSLGEENRARNYIDYLEKELV